MAYHVVGRRDVPPTSTDRGIVSGKVVTVQNVNGGNKAVCVKLHDGRTAWGFSSTWDSAETLAIKNAESM